MSLKAKIEAVIYASEDPVTLVQLVGLLGEEAQAELELRDTAQRLLALEIAAPQDDAIAEAAGAFDPDTEDGSDPARPDRDSFNAETPAAAESDAPIEDAEVGSALESEAGQAADSDADSGPAGQSRREKERARRLRAYFREILDQLIADYAAPESDRGLEIREVAGGFRFATKPEYHDAVRGFVKSLKPPLKLSLQALETLAVVAYKQPVTSPEISEIRGVDSGGVLGSLMTRKLITTAGRKHVIGRPILYKTTKEFLLRFGLKDVGELPSIEEFEKLAGEMEEQEEMPMSQEPDELAEPTEEQLESDGVEAAPEPIADEVIVDGRESALPPVYDEADDPSAADGQIQDGQIQDAAPEEPIQAAAEAHQHSLLEEVIDEISHGNLLP